MVLTAKKSASKVFILEDRLEAGGKPFANVKGRRCPNVLEVCRRDRSRGIRTGYHRKKIEGLWKISQTDQAMV